MSQPNEFSGRNVIVTGGTGALGRGVVALLVERGARVHIPCFDQAELKDFPWQDHEQVHISHPVDLADEASVSDYFAGVPDLWASVHIAGGFAFTPIPEATLDVLDQQVRMNTATCLLCCREASRHMKGGGRIVNVTARPALDARQGARLTPYVVSKSGVAAITQALSTELLDQDILVNAIAPSTIDTPSNREAMADADFDSWVKPEDAAEVVAFLASPRNRVVSGALVPVYGKA